MGQKKNKDKLWTSGFFILWQGQLVSTLGDEAYSIALGFWVLQVTGSTALMGMLMAASTLPGVLVSPFAGVIVDRYKRKKLLIMMDMIRGLSILFISVAAFKGMLAIWEVFAAGIILSICGAVFRPGVNSSVPDIVPTSKLQGANSMLSIANNGSSMIGNVASGFLFQLLGAPILFLFDGLSYLFSGFSILFVKIPIVKKKKEQNFFQDMKDGFSFMWKLKGLRYILFMAAVLNFFSAIGIVLLMPLFQQTSYLGAGKYGASMGFFMGGVMVGYLFSSVVSIPNAKKLKIFIFSIVISNISLSIAINQVTFVLMIIFLILGGFFNAIVNVILLSTVQASTPQDMRGKVMAFIGMISQGLTPFAQGLGGILGGFISIKFVITFAFAIQIVLIMPFYFVKSFEEFITYDYGMDKIEEIAESEATNL